MRQILIPLDLRDAAASTAEAGRTVRRLGGTTMGTTWSAMVCVADDRCLAGLERGIEEALLQVVRQMSPWEPGSCLVRFGDRPAGSWHEVPEDFYTVLECALAVARQSGGALDPTVGRLVQACGFGPAPPSADDEHPRAPGPDWKVLKLDAAGRRVLQPGGVRLDLCAVAKGFAVDRMAEVVERHGISAYLVEIGGELRGGGVKPNGEPWWVAIEGAGDACADTIVALCGVSVASSGGYRRHRSEGPVLHTHLIDPRQGVPLCDLTSTTTVVASRCMEADAWATALAVLGPGAGVGIAEENGVAVLFASGDGPNRNRLMSAPMAAMLG